MSVNILAESSAPTPTSVGRRRRFICISILASTLSFLAGVRAFGGVTLRNLEIDASGGFEVVGTRVAFAVNELRHNQTDLNGDGDTDDNVLHVFDAATGVITNVGLDTFFLFQFDGDRVVFGVREPNQGGQDLNGDGDTLDLRVLHVYDVASDTATNLGLVSSALLFQVAGGRVAFQVPEMRQGDDLNGDSDTDDEVMHLFDAATGVTTNLGLAASGFRLVGDRLAFRVAEAGEGAELNGDGDMSDLVLHVHNISTGTTTNLEFAVSDFVLGGDFVAFSVAEFAQGQSLLNSDADFFDAVLHVYDTTTATVTNVGIDARGLQIETDVVAFFTFEFAEGNQDLNGDGDHDDGDRVMHFYEADTDALTNVGLDVDRFELFENGIAFSVRESNQDGMDLNGDLDLDDRVAHILELGSDPLNLGLDSLGFATDGRRVAMQVREMQQSADLNGDGDVGFESVLHVFDTATNAITNVGLATGGFRVDGDRVALDVFEVFQNGEDLNGDGDVSDRVFHVFDIASGVAENLGIAVSGLRRDGELIALTASEDGQGQTDLNRDGDADDFVLHVTPDASALVGNLIDAVMDLELPNGTETSLVAKLDAALDKLSDSNEANDGAAIGALEAFINSVEAQRGNKIGEAEADALIAAAEVILDLLSP